MESLNSIVLKDDENWNEFNRMNNNNSFVIENPEPEPKHDKEMLPDTEMQGNSPTTQASVGDAVETSINVMEGSKKQESIWLGKKGKATAAPKPPISRASKRIEKPPKKVPIKKLQLEEKKKDRKAKAESAKEQAPKKKTSPLKQTNEEQPDMPVDVKAQAKAVTDIEVADSQQQKYYMNFDFYFKRTSFRTMTLYFKTAFKPFFEKWKGQKKNREIKGPLLEFTKEHFPGLIESLPPGQAQFEFLELFKLLVFSHRHNKNDSYLQDPLVSFAVVREPMYKYSKQA